MLTFYNLTFFISHFALQIFSLNSYANDWSMTLDPELYNNVTSVGIGCWPWSIKGHTHMDGVKSTSADLFLFFHAPKILQ